MKDNVIPNLEFKEDFRTEASVLDNDITIVGSPTIDNGISGFSASNYVTLPSNILLNKHAYSFSIDLKFPSSFNTTATRILDGGANWILYADSASNNLTFIYRVSGAQQLGVLNVASLLNQRVRLTISIYISGTSVICDMFANSLSSNTSDIGTMTNLPSSITVGSDAGVNFYNDVIYSIQYYDNYALTAEDHLAIYNSTFSKDLLPEESILTLPCNDSYNNGSGTRVTSAQGTSITEATLGDGSTSSTFPTLENERLFSFDGTDYINCGDHDNFSFTVNDPFSIGFLTKFPSNTAQLYFITKASGIGVGGGEWLLYSPAGSWRLLVMFLDNTTGGYKYWLSPTNSINKYKVQSAVFTYDGSATYTSTSGKIYIDGIGVTSTQGSSGTFNDMYNTTKPVTIGGLSIGNYLENGNKIGLPFIISKELSSLQVKTIDKQMKLWSQI